MSRYINEVFDSLATIRLAEMKLRGMANTYYRLNQTDTANNLMDIAEVLDAKVTTIRQAVAVEVNELAGNIVEDHDWGPDAESQTLKLIDGGKKDEPAN